MRLLFRSTLPLLLILLVFSSCAKEDDYSDGISCKELMEIAEKEIPTDLGYTDFGNGQILYYFEETDAFDDVCLRYSTRSENINEVGIFHSQSKREANKIKQQIETYLDEMKEEQSAFIASYAPDELPKLEEAEIRQFGNYTVYTILFREDRDNVFQALNKRLLISKE